MDAEPFTLEVKDETPAVVTAPAYGTLDLRRADCMDMMAEFPDGYFDLAIVDPPYGINWLEQVKNPNKGKNWKVHEYKQWDQSPPPPEYFIELRRVSKYQIIWGGNYMIENLKSSPCWIIWDKMQEFGGAVFEMAWTSFKSPAKAFRMSRVEAYANQEKFHPTQKPVKLLSPSKYQRFNHGSNRYLCHASLFCRIYCPCCCSFFWSLIS